MLRLTGWKPQMLSCANGQDSHHGVRYAYMSETTTTTNNTHAEHADLISLFEEIIPVKNYYQVEPLYKKINVSIKNEETGEVTIKEELNAQEYYKIVKFPNEGTDDIPTLQLRPPTHLLAKIIAVEEIETPESTQDNPASLYFIDAVNIIAFAYAK